MSFSENFNRICREKGTTPTGLLRKMGYASSQKVVAWNKGSLPKEAMLVRLAEELGCTVSSFFQDEAEIPAPPAMTLSEDEQDILRIFRALPRRVQHQFMSAVYTYEAEQSKP